MRTIDNTHTKYFTQFDVKQKMASGTQNIQREVYIFTLKKLLYVFLNSCDSFVQ